ncbi:major facilitator superfamily domain-containing protein [Apiosordaria backusii]|uniref:Major facilitator superfamily domain-containing protein n=1 Tax=Apiosordaria backusii TaxID=314023 RepID=A0AA40AEP5_9PEZI|nr:major facilitator superfamily domain-containing protein [Apiosordaria backusii]
MEPTTTTSDSDASNSSSSTYPICLCTFLVGLDFNLIATAIPVITSEFNSTRDIGWYGAAFMVSMCASQPLAGKMYTLFPKKMAYLSYLLLFEVGSLVCALAPSSRALIAGRAIAGFETGVWTGVMGSSFSIASIVGPVIAGGFAQNVTWRWCFWINLPIGGAAAVVFFALVHLRPAPTEFPPLKNKLGSIDGLGLVLFAGSITMLLLALQWGGIEYAWSSSVVVGLLVGFGVVFILFVFWTVRQKEEALIPPRLFTVNRNPALLCAAAFFVNGPFQVIIYWLPVWFQGVLSASPTKSGIDFFPTVISDVLAAFIGAGIVTQLGWWNPFLIFAEILGGVGYSLASNLSHLAMQASLPQDLVPLGSSTLLAVISTSCAIFAAIGQAVFQRQLQVNLGKVVSSEVVERIIDSGVTDVDQIVGANMLRRVIDKYSESVTNTFYIPAVAPVLSFFLLLGCKWISVKSKQSATTARKEKDDAEKGQTHNRGRR